MKKAQNKELELQKVAEEIEKCWVCKKDKIGMAVPGEGSADANIVFVGEAPGKKESETGKPFVGRAGNLLRQNISEVLEISDKDVYITSPVKYLPKHVTPKPEEIAHGRIHLLKQLRIIEPQIIVLMGSVAAQAVLGEKIPLSKWHGHFYDPNLLNGGLAKDIKLEGKIDPRYFIIYHPAAPLHAPALRKVFKSDFLNLKKLVKKMK